MVVSSAGTLAWFGRSRYAFRSLFLPSLPSPHLSLFLSLSLSLASIPPPCVIQSRFALFASVYRHTLSFYVLSVFPTFFLYYLLSRDFSVPAKSFILCTTVLISLRRQNFFQSLRIIVRTLHVSFFLFFFISFIY